MKRLFLIGWSTALFLVWISTYAQGQTALAIDRQLDSSRRLMKSMPDKAFLLATEVLESSKLASLDSLIGKAQLVRGQILQQSGLFQPAAEAFYEAELIFKNNDMPALKAQVNNELGQVYYKIKTPEDALSRHESALKIYQELNDSEGEAETKSFIGGMYEKMGSYPKALRYQREALYIFESLMLESQLAFVRENIGSIYEDLEQYDSALVNFQTAFRLNSALGDSLRIIGNLNNLGDVLRKTRDPEQGILFSMRAAEMSERLGLLYQEKSAVVDVSKAYADMLDYENAYKYLEKSRQLSDQVFSIESARQLAIQEVQNSLFAKNQQIKQLEQIRAFDTSVKWMLLFLVSLLCVLGWVIFNRQKLKIRNNRELLRRQEEILLVKEQLINTEKENLKLLELKMEAEDRAHSKSLTAQTLHVIDKNQMLEDIQAKLKSILEEDPKEQKKKIRNLIKQIDFNFSHDTNWDDFKQTFERVHQDFFKNIQERSGGLTPAEMKLASLMRLNLNSKEISSSLGISMDSLRISRYRLRKKLNLQKDDSLQQFLLCI